MQPPNFSLRDVIWSVTSLALGTFCLYAGGSATSWTIFWLLAALPAFSTGLMALLHKKRAGLVWGGIAAVAIGHYYAAMQPVPSVEWLTGGKCLGEGVINFFEWRPGHFFAVAAAWGVLFLAAFFAKARYPQIRCRPAFVVYLLWLAGAFAERDALVHRSNIRIDAVVLWPMLFFGTAIALVLTFQSVACATASAGAEATGEGTD